LVAKLKYRLENCFFLEEKKIGSSYEYEKVRRPMTTYSKSKGKPAGPAGRCRGGPSSRGGVDPDNGPTRSEGCTGSQTQGLLFTGSIWAPYKKRPDRTGLYL